MLLESITFVHVSTATHAYLLHANVSHFRSKVQVVSRRLRGSRLLFRVDSLLLRRTPLDKISATDGESIPPRYATTTTTRGRAFDANRKGPIILPEEDEGASHRASDSLSLALSPDGRLCGARRRCE